MTRFAMCTRGPRCQDSTLNQYETHKGIGRDIAGVDDTIGIEDVVECASDKNRKRQEQPRTSGMSSIGLKDEMTAKKDKKWQKVELIKVKRRGQQGYIRYQAKEDE